MPRGCLWGHTLSHKGFWTRTVSSILLVVFRKSRPDSSPGSSLTEWRRVAGIQWVLGTSRCLRKDEHSWWTLSCDRELENEVSGERRPLCWPKATVWGELNAHDVTERAATR